MRTKQFLYVCLGVLLLTVAYACGVTNARGQIAEQDLEGMTDRDVEMAMLHHQVELLRCDVAYMLVALERPGAFKKDGYLATVTAVMEERLERERAGALGLTSDPQFMAKVARSVHLREKMWQDHLTELQTWDQPWRMTAALAALYRRNKK